VVRKKEKKRSNVLKLLLALDFGFLLSIINCTLSIAKFRFAKGGWDV